MRWIQFNISFLFNVWNFFSHFSFNFAFYRNKKNTAQTTPDTEASQPQSDGAAEKAPKKRKTKKLKLGLNEGNGANRETYTWTQILTEVEVS